MAGDPALRYDRRIVSDRSATGAPSAPWVAAACAFLAALVASVVIAGAPFPPGVFVKYQGAAAGAAEAAERGQDYSLLYLALVRALLPLGAEAVLWVQCLLHAVAAAAAARVGWHLAGARAGLLGGVGFATYPPFLVYCGVHEPEAVIVAVVTIACCLGLEARACLRPAPTGVGQPGAGRQGQALAVLAAVAIGLAALLRPQHLALAPVWAAWMARRRPWIALLVLGVAAGVFLAPSLVPGSAGGALRMNPGPVFYEGNGPAATGMTRQAPALVRSLERSHKGSADYGHVAYRRLASHALGRQATAAQANRYWSRLALEGLRARPGAALARLGDKLLLALMPHEAHDLTVAEHLGRRVRAVLPWGFGLLLVCLPWLLAAPRRLLADLAGPLAMGGLALLVQVLFYASARQRLPLAAALLLAAPPLLSALLRPRSGLPARPGVLVALGVALAALIGYLAAPWAIGDETLWDRVFGRQTGGFAFAARVLDGQQLRPWRRAAQLRFEHGSELVLRGEPAAVLALLEPLEGEDFTVDDRRIGVPSYWIARAALALGDVARGQSAAAAAARQRPGDVEVAALDRYLSSPPAVLASEAAFRPPGIDPASARHAFAWAAWHAGDRDLANLFVAPLLADFPELAGARGTESEAGDRPARD